MMKQAMIAGVLSAALVSQSDAQAPDRTTKPALGPVPELKLPAVQEFALPNGLKVRLMEKHNLPLVQVNLLVDAGSARDDAGKPGLASLTAAMLDEGVAGRNALEIADAFELLGARFGTNAGVHGATVTLRVPVARFDEALALMGEIVQRPALPQAELDRLKKERLTALTQQHDEPQAISYALFSSTLFGKTHPYGRGGIDDATALNAITTADLRRFHDTYYRANNATLVVVGDVSPAGLQAVLGKAFGRWTRGNVSPLTVPAAPQVKGRTIYIVDKPGSAQSVIRLGRIGVPRSTGDYFALEVLNTILGGSFTSRLNQNLREKHGYAYGAGSEFEYNVAAGPWSAASSVQTKSTGPALTEFMNELRAIRAPISQDEVDRARNYLAMGFAQNFQSVGQTAFQLTDAVLFGLPRDYFNTYTARVLAVSKADVERVAQQYIDPDNVAIFVVGDRKEIEPQVRAQNLGEIRFLEVKDVLGAIPQ